MCETLDVRIGEHSSISPLTKKLSQPKNSFTEIIFTCCNHSASCNSFGILTHGVKKFLLELKELANFEINNL